MSGGWPICTITIPYFRGVSADFSSYVRVPIAPEKTCAVTTTLSFAEMQLDTLMLEARLSADKTLIYKDTNLNFFRERRPLYTSLTDASGSLGFRTIFQNHWCYGSWPSSWASFNIASYFSCFHQFVSLW